MGEKENEIPVAQRVWGTLLLDNTIVTADAWHTQTATAQPIVDRGGDYLLTVQANQPNLQQLLAGLDWRFFPSADHAGQSPWPHRDPHDAGPAGV